MQDRSCEKAVPLSFMMEAYSTEKGTHVGNHESTSEDSSSYELFYDSLSDIQDREFSNELSAFLSEDEVSKSLELAHKSIVKPVKEDGKANQELTYASSCKTKGDDQDTSKRTQVTSPNSLLISAQTLPEQKNQNTYPQEANRVHSVTGKQSSISPLLPARPSFIRSLKHAERCSPSMQKLSPDFKTTSAGDVPFKNKLCDKAANLIEELSSIFREATKTRVRSPDGNSSSPDSGYLSPKNKQITMSNSLRNPTPDKTCPEITPENEVSEVTHTGTSVLQRKDGSQANENASLYQVKQEIHSQPSPPRFTQKLRSQEVAEGRKVLLECRVAGNPTPHVRWFCEGEELQNSPDIQLCSESGGLHTLIIAEAFEDDTGRYCCLASNSVGSDSTSAELFVEGASSSDSDSEIFRSKSGGMPQAQKKSTSVSLTIGSSAPKAGITTAVIQPLSVPNHQVQSPTSYLCRLDGSKPSHAAPIFTKELQDSTASEGQVVVLECRVRGAPPLHVIWSRQGTEIQDSPDFRILQKKPRSASEPEEICTVVIAETFPEDAGTFTCTARNDYGSVTSSAKLTVLSASSESSRYDFSMREQNNDDFLHFPPPPPNLEISSVELPPKHSESHQMNNARSSVAAFQLQLNSSEKETNGVHPSHGVNGVINGNTSIDKSAPHPDGLLSPTKTPPPVLAKPKLGFPKKTGRTARIASDEEIQGTKDAVIQDLERKLRFKEDLLNNGQPKLTYEEKMARRLLGADSAATVFNIQEPEEELAGQEYKVSSFEQRLISEIEFRLERSPVEESDDEVEDGEHLDNSVAPYFEMKLKHYKIFEGMPVTFTCSVSGNPNPKIYWFKDGKQISKRSEHYRMQREPDGTCSLHTTASTLDDDGNYTIMAANPQGRVSCTGRLMVQAVNQRGRSPRTPPSQPHVRRPRSRSRDSGDENEPIQERFFRPHFLQAPGDLIVQEGKLCRMDCKVSGLPTPDISWQLNGRVMRSDSSHKMLVRENGVHSLIIEPVTAKDAGIYTCVATNRAGQNTFSLELIVAAKEAHKPPVFVEKLQNTGVAEGYPVRLECRVSGVPHPQIFWKKENESLTYNTDRVSMHQDNHGYICLLVQGATKDDAGWYTVSAKNEAGIVSCTARLDVYTQWQQQPQTTKPKKVRPSASRYAALSDQGLDIKAAFQPEANPGHLTLQSGLVESDDL
ncbi:palladin isoform X4 [Rhineura floridana]|uniref:palladin isoform X4 n=1 Tax=Rhineura floridana TaxID=261503 RepID=UPI002AC8937F|nr:palladin isoform X4 [Rhineura floridana]